MMISISFTVALALTLYGCTTPPSLAQNVENAAAVAQYEQLLDGCRLEGRKARSYDVYEACADKVDAHICKESGNRCKDGGK